MFRSGLALAGANGLGDGLRQDGLLTAGELALVDLSGTELAVLSACNTGVGEASVGNGIFGLIRALRIAGARSQIATLWSVNDRATQELMVDLYDRLKSGQPAVEALRASQIAMINKEMHPYYWAGFMHSGEWERIGTSGQADRIVNVRRATDADERRKILSDLFVE
jgi:CHAT domain-containing protein